MILRFCAGLSFILLACADPVWAIRTGWLAIDQEFQSAVQIWTLEDNRPKYLCSGVVLAPDTVATTTSCIYGDHQTPSAAQIFISTTARMDYEKLDQAIGNVAAIAKKGFPVGNSKLILLFLKQALSVPPAVLLRAQESFQLRLLKDVVVAGYGAQEKSSSALSSKGWGFFLGDQPKSTFGEKFIARSQLTGVSSQELQIGKVPEDGSACVGDEGAPIYAQIDSTTGNSERVIGLIIASDKLKDCAIPSLALRLDTLRDAIDDIMRRECEQGERVACEKPIATPKEPPKDPVRVPLKEPTLPPPAETPPPVPPKSAKTTNPTAPQPQKRRLNAAVEGAGCSCQQVFTRRP